MYTSHHCASSLSKIHKDLWSLPVQNSEPLSVLPMYLSAIKGFHISQLASGQEPEVKLHECTPWYMFAKLLPVIADFLQKTACQGDETPKVDANAGGLCVYAASEPKAASTICPIRLH